MSTQVKAHITGTVWEIRVQPGQSVEEDEVLIVLESMKMEMPVEAPCAGVVKEIVVESGDAVDEDQVLLTLD